MTETDINSAILVALSKHRNYGSLAGENPRACKICSEIKEVSCFTIEGVYSDGSPKRRIYCKPCFASYQRAKADRKTESARVALYNKKNPHISASNMRKLRAENPQHYVEYNRNWRAQNKGRVAEYDKAKRVNRRAIAGSRQVALKQGVWARVQIANNFECFYCGLAFRPLTQDHFTRLRTAASMLSTTSFRLVEAAIPLKGPQVELRTQRRLGAL